MGIWDIAYVLFKHKWRIVLTTIVIIGSLFAFSFLWPPRFEASSRFLLSKTTAVNLDPSIFPQITTALSRNVTGNEEANNERQIILSRPVIEAVVQNLDLANDYVPDPPQGILASIQHRLRIVIVWAKGIPRWILETFNVIEPKSYEKRYISAIEKLSGDLTVQQIPDSDVLKISMSGWYPEHIAAIVRETSRQYLRYHLEVHQGGNATEFYADYQDQARQKLEALEDELTNYRSEHAIVDINKVEQAWLEKVELLERQRIHLRKNLITTGTKLVKIRELMADPTKPIIPSPEINDWDSVIALNDARIEHELRLTGLLDRYTPDHPLVQQQRTGLEHLKGALRKEVERLVFLMERQTEDWRAEDAAVARALETLRWGGGVTLPEHRKTITRLERSISDANAIYEQIAKRRADAELRTSRDARMVKVKLLEEASDPTRSVWPDLFMNLLVGGPLAPILAICIAFFVEGLRRTFRRAEDIEDRLELPAIAVLPAARNKRALRVKARDGLERLASVALEQPLDPPPILLLTESVEGEGSSDVATLLAETLAGTGRKVLLVDYRNNGSRARAWSVGPTAPATTEIAGKTVHETSISGLSLARASEGAQTVRSHAELEQELNALRQGQDITLVDAPALEGSSLASGLASAATASILVVRSDTTGEMIVQRGVEQIKDAGTEVLGAVLTGYRQYIPRFLEQRL